MASFVTESQSPPQTMMLFASVTISQISDNLISERTRTFEVNDVSATRTHDYHIEQAGLVRNAGRLGKITVI
jgi:hypothetical protein